MPPTPVRFTSRPLTEPPPSVIATVVDVFRRHEREISTSELAKGLTSDGVLGVLRGDLVGLGFQVEKGKLRQDKIDRLVFFGENGVPALSLPDRCVSPRLEVWPSRSRPAALGWGMPFIEILCRPA